MTGAGSVAGNVFARAIGAVLPFAVFLYAVASLTSMAGMEIFGTLAQGLALLFLLADPRAMPAVLSRVVSRGDIALLALFAVVSLGVMRADPTGFNWGQAIGAARWMPLFILTRVAFEISWSDGAQPAAGILMFLGGAVACYGLAQYIFGLDLLAGGGLGALPPSFVSESGRRVFRAEGLFGSAFTFGHSMALTACFPFAFGLLAVWRRRRLDGAILIVAFVCGLAVVASLARGAWVAFAVALLAMAVVAGGKRFAKAFIVLPVLCAGLWLWAPGVGSRAGSLVNASLESNEHRLAIWNAHWEMAQDHPLLGVGYELSERMAPAYLARVGAQGVEAGDAQNMFLQYWASTGLLGLLCYLIFVGYFFAITVRTWFLIPEQRLWERAIVLGALGAQIAAHVGGVADCNLRDAEVNHQFLLILAGVSALHSAYLSEHGSSIKRPRNERPPGAI